MGNEWANWKVRQAFRLDVLSSHLPRSHLRPHSPEDLLSVLTGPTTLATILSPQDTQHPPIFFEHTSAAQPPTVARLPACARCAPLHLPQLTSYPAASDTHHQQAAATRTAAAHATPACPTAMATLVCPGDRLGPTVSAPALAMPATKPYAPLSH
jgi:hypothetical protein